jgi:valyl-tRNA synthetase
MELSKNYMPSDVEGKWYAHWLEKGYFNSRPDDRPPFTVVIPPPNVTGVLHMGHTLNETVQDILVRKARMEGFNACWVPGTDHASIATEAKVVGMLRERGISKSSLTREEFLKYAWEWKEKYGGIILEQLRKLGTSIDWNRVNFTMDPDYYRSVIGVFVDLYRKGLIYRANRMVNWDPLARTALSDEEVIYKDVQSKLYYLNYKLDIPGDLHITVATVRPETILGDTAICVHPDDERYKHLQGKYAFVPLIDRRIPIIADEYVDPAFGTGALKITPAHDRNDFQLSQKHGLEVIDILNEDATLNSHAGIYAGLDRFEARKRIVKDLSEQGYLARTEDYSHQVGFSERTDAVIEPALRIQWWVDMKEMAKPALDVVMNEEIKFYPSKFRNSYRNWMENIKDWCISRQLIWGHRIPAWYDGEGNPYVALNEQEAIALFRKEHPGHGPEDPVLVQDEDVLDTWFSSWLWPFEVFKGLSDPGNADVKYYYPTNVLVTAPEIIFFWVARMVMAGFEYMGEKPFTEVYFTGIVRDKQGRKMSKSLGNSPDLLDLIDKYGADAVRFGIMIASPAGNDILFDEGALEQGRNFNNKLWNALKLIRGWEERTQESAPDGPEHFAVKWFEHRLAEARTEVEKLLAEFRLSEALKTIYSLIWDDFCSWYLEWVKPGFEQKIEAVVYRRTIGFYESLVQILHPFMPFITEEIYHLLKDRDQGDDLTIKQFEKVPHFDSQVISWGEELKYWLTAIREFRKENNLKNATPIRNMDMPKAIFGDDESVYMILKKQLNLANLSFQNPPSTPITSTTAATTTTVYPIKNHQVIFETDQVIDTAKRDEELKKELEYLQGFLETVDKKLSNERFVQNAKPAVIEMERKKRADAEAKIRSIENTLQSKN